MKGSTLDTGALIALERGSAFMRVLVASAIEEGVGLAIPAGVLAQAWRGTGRQARIARLLHTTVAEVVPLDHQSAMTVGKLCAQTGAADIVDVSVVLCARERGHNVVTSDPGDLRGIDPALTLVPPD